LPASAAVIAQPRHEAAIISIVVLAGMAAIGSCSPPLAR